MRGHGGGRSRDKGKLLTMRATRTYLELRAPGEFRPAFGVFPDVTLRRVPPDEATPALYRACYRTVGEAFHWRDRSGWTDAGKRAPPRDPHHPPLVAGRRGG